MRRALERAQALHLEGRLSEAEAHYRNVLARQPDAIEAIRGLGVLAYQHGRIDEAVAFFARGVTMQPEAADFQANLAESLRIAGRPEQAIEHLEKALTLDATVPDAWNTLGLLEHGRGRFAQAETAFREAIRLRPGYAAAHVNLGNTLAKLGRLDNAELALSTALQIDPEHAAALTGLGQLLIDRGDPVRLDTAESLLRRAIAAAPGLSQPVNSLGNVLRLQGRLADATACYRRALEIDPRGGAPRQNIGKLRQQQGQYDEAARWFEAARIVEPDDARYHASRGSLWAAQRRYGEAARSYRLALEENSQSVEAHQGLGESLVELHHVGEAETCFREAIRLDPAQPLSWLGLANLLAERGEFEQSCEAARQALARRPSLAEAYVRLACNLRGRLPASDVQAMEELLRLRYLSDDCRAGLLYGLADVCDEHGDYRGAAERLERANASQAKARAARGEVHDPGQYSCFVERLITSFTTEVIARARGWGDPDARPVFVVGLPRSGTTLIEQILASHRDVHGVGELPDARRVFQSLPSLVGLRACDPCDAVLALESNTSRAAARTYLDRLDELAPREAVRVVDKMPDNIDLLGLVALLWPRARVIVCHRDPRDVAVSCWHSNFAMIRWANDPEHIARRFADHRRILDYWRRTEPVKWLEVSYESVVSDLEGQSRRMIEFVGLDWDPGCLEFHLTRRVVRSASHVQVRQPVYSRSVGRWRDYASLLQPLFEAMERHGFEGPG